MQRLLNARSGKRQHWAPLLLVAALACTGLCGCADTWDELTSKDFKASNWFAKHESPLVVLRDSTDGDKRARALRELREPKEFGGSEADQDVVIKILNTAASNERQPLCRLAAIETLGRFKDPRTVEGLTAGFYNAGSFNPEVATVIRCQALSALGNTGNPAAVELLAKVVREPPAEGPESDRQQALDVRIAAARALGNFKHYQATEALVRVLETEKDVALRDRANESLQAATGKKLPPDAKAWQEVLNQPGDHNPEEQPKKLSLTGWFGGS